MGTCERGRKSLLLALAVVLLISVFLTTVQAQIPNVLSYSGYLTNANGNPMNGMRNLTFALYTTPTGGTPVWVEGHQNVLLNGGTFHVVLGRGTVPQPLNIPFDQQYYLGTKVGNDPEMSPRQELMPAAYSFQAKVAQEVPDTSISAEKLRPNSVTDDKILSVSWNKITGLNEGVAGRVWSLQGNNNTNPGAEFLGTTDGQDLIFRTNNVQRMVMHSEGNVDINSHLLTLGSITSRTSATEGAFYLGDNNFGLRRMGGENNVELFSTTGNLFLTGGNVGIGTFTPAEKLHVTGNVLFTGNLTGSGNALFGGGLHVDGPATLNDATVLGDLNATGNFVVSGSGEFANLRVTNDGLIGNDVVPGRLGIGRIYSDVNLNVLANTGANHPFNVQVGEVIRFRLHNDGRVLVGSDPADGNFAVDIRAKKHGIVLSMNPGGQLNSSTKFISFQDGSTVRGRIEGQSLGELFPRQAIDAVLNGAKLGALFAASVIDPGALIAQIAESGVWFVRQVKAQINVGVAFESGAGDYAEWLPRRHESEKIEPGDVVGVFGGRISRTTKGAERMMVVSSNPIVLGNMPEENKEHLYEKVAFLGQVFVKVIGAVEEGDYIVSSGRDDGCAVAIPPKLMTADEFPKVVGRAWGSSNVPYKKLVNVAVGMNMGGDVAPIVKRVENNVRDMRARLEASSKLLAHAQTRLEELESKVSMLNIQHEEIVQLRSAVKALQQGVQAGESSSARRPQVLSVAAEKQE